MDDDLRARIASLRAALDDLDYYEILDVDPDAGHDDVRDAFYRFASDLHPDQYSSESEEVRERVLAIFKRANEAYGVLSNPQKRRRYDEGLGRGEKRLGPQRGLAAEERKDPSQTVCT